MNKCIATSQARRASQGAISSASWTSLLLPVLLILLVAAGCSGSPPASNRAGGAGGGGGGNTTERDIAEYNALTVQLEKNRVRFGGEEVDEMVPAGNTIYWLEYGQWDPTIHSLDTESKRKVDYEIPLAFDSLNVRVSTAAVAYAEAKGQDVIYHVFDSAEPAREITTVTMEAPTDEQRWWAYALEGTDLYIVETKSLASPDTKLYRVPVGGALKLVTTFESAGCEVGEFWDFGVESGTLVFIESGRIWSLDLASNRATWLENKTEIQGSIEFTRGGALFTQYDGSSDVPTYFDYGTRKPSNVAEQIAAVDYVLNPTFASLHHYYQDITRWGDYFIYGADGGIFAFDVVQNRVAPVLLTPRVGETSDVRVDYRYPVVLDNGLLFVTALQSESGSVGADGRVYQVNLKNALP